MSIRSGHAVCALALAAMCACGRVRAQRYTVTDLGTLGGPLAFPSGISGGFIAGGSLVSDDTQGGYLWSPAGGLAGLGGLGGDTSVAFGVNTGGDAAGVAYLLDDTTEHAAAWLSGVPVDLGTLSGAYSAAYGINADDLIVGVSTLDTAGDTGTEYRGFVYTPAGGLFGIGVLPNGGYSLLHAVNGLGQAAGEADTVHGSGSFAGAAQHAIVWDLVSGLTDLPTLGGRNASAWAINDAGQIAGESDTVSGDEHACLWSPLHIPQDLGAPPGYDSTAAFSVNRSGQVTGEAYDTSTGLFGGFVWDSRNGMRDVNALVPPGFSVHLFDVYDNDLGWLSAAGFDAAGEEHIYLLTPNQGAGR